MLKIIKISHKATVVYINKRLGCRPWTERYLRERPTTSLLN